MKKLLIIFSIFLFVQGYVNATETNNIKVFSENNNFGLKDSSNNVIVEAQYKKLIKIGSSSWLIQKKSRYGLIDNNGNYLIYPKYRHAERILGKFVKLGNDNDYGLYGETGNIIIPPMYSSIDLLYGKMFLTCRKYKYGVVDFDGNILLANDFDDIYMPTKNNMRIQYKGEWYELEKTSPTNLKLPENVKQVTIDNDNITITKLVADTSIMSGYYAISTTDYILKIISSLSPAYEETIDDLMLSHGAETVSIFMRLTWLPQFPYIYVRKYINNIKAPNNGPLSPIKQNIKRKIIN